MSKKTRKEGWIVPAKEKIALFCGAGSYQATNTFVTTFMSVYLLMVGVSPTVAAGALLFLKAWDAMTDVVVGYLIDKIRFKPGKNAFTKWLFSGRYMPWFRCEYEDRGLLMTEEPVFETEVAFTETEKDGCKGAVGSFAHAYDAPGTYFATVQVQSNRHGDPKDIFTQPKNLARARVIVE